MELSTALALILSPLLLFALFILGKKGEKRYHPIAGTVFHQIANFGRLHDYFADLARTHRTYKVLGAAGTQIYTADPINVEYILKTNFRNYRKGKYHGDILGGLMGEGIFAVDGEKWLHQRKLANRDLSTKVLSDFSCSVFRSNAAKLAMIISKSADSGNAVDAQDLFMKATLDSIFKVGFGIELDTLTGSNEEGNIFSEAFDDSNALTFYRYMDFFWKLKRLLNIGSEAALKKKKEMVDGFVYNVIQKKKEQISRRDAMVGEDILSRSLATMEDDPSSMSDRYLRDIILNYVIAGRDTTAVTLSWFMYMLCKNPHVQKRIAQETRGAIGASEKMPVGEFIERLTEEAIGKMHYLHAAITETLRLYPAVAVDGKLCCSDDTWPDGFNVRRGDSVMYVPYSMGRMKFLWGEDAEVFRPERWLDHDGVFQAESPFKFTAFQAGPRICAGKEFAYSQMKVFAAVLVSFFTFKLHDENSPVRYRTMFTLHIDGGLYIQPSHKFKIP